MILERNTDYKVESNIGGHKIDMGLDMSSLAHLMGVLANLYSDRPYAIVREYSTNARDAHIAAGNSAPIQITLPTVLAPVLKITDFGIGMNEQDIIDTYSRYGASTKRDTNDQQGVLGLGCKSALAYTSVFTLTANKDGERIVVSVRRNDDGSGSMTIVEKLPTDEPNGVEISIYIEESDIHSFRKAAEQFFRFWEAGTVLVDGQAPEHHGGLKLADDMWIIDGNQDYLVMGNVPYPTNFDVGLINNHALVVYAPMASVSFVPSREALEYGERTKAAVKEWAERYHKAIHKAVQDSIDKAETSQAAVKAMLDWQYALPAHVISKMEFTYKGEVIPSQFQLSGNKRFTVVAQHSTKLSEHSRMAEITMGSWHKALWIENYDRVSFTAGQRKKLDKWSEMKSRMPQRYVLVPGRVETTWIADEEIVPWEEIAAIKIPRSTSKGSGVNKSIPGSYEAWQDGDKIYELPADDIEPDNPLFYHVGTAEGASAYAAVLKKDHDEFTFVVMGNNRLKKFQRFFPQAKPVVPEVKRLYNQWMRKLTPVSKNVLAMNTMGVYNDLIALDHKRILDPVLRTAVRRAKRVDLTKVLQERRIYMVALGLYYYKWANGGGADPVLKNWVNPLEPYPLYDRGTLRTDTDHVYLYLNSIYAATKGA